MQDSFANYAGKRVLITGGLGFIGSNLAIKMAKADALVTVVDSMIPVYGGKVSNVEPVADLIKINFADIRDQYSMRYLVKNQDYIFSLAGQISHLASMQEPLVDLDINCRAQLSLLECCRQVNSKAKIIFTSTRQIYGKPSYLPVDEKHPIVPVDVNGVSQLAAEEYFSLYHKVYGIPSCSLRLTNTYGPRMDLMNESKGFVGVFLRRVLCGEKIQFFGGGGQRRDFNYVDDVLDAVAIAADNESCYGSKYNLAGSSPYSLLDFANALKKHIDFDSEVVPFPEERKKIDVGDYYGDCTKFTNLTGWTPKTDIDIGLQKTVEYFKERKNLYINQAEVEGSLN